jgi:hypothetical protein
MSEDRIRQLIDDLRDFSQTRYSGGGTLMSWRLNSNAAVDRVERFLKETTNAKTQKG